MITPVALMTWCRLVACVGSAAIAPRAATSPGVISPRRARCCAATMVSLTALPAEPRRRRDQLGQGQQRVGGRDAPACVSRHRG